MPDLYDRAIDGFVRRVPAPAVAAVAVLLYGGGGLALPLALHWRLVFLVEVNLISTLLAATVLLAWFILEIEAGQRRRLVEWTTNLRLLDSTEFEWLVGELFRREGWEVTETGRVDGPDGNVDLVLRQKGQRRIVQCKRWESWPVGVDEIRKFAGTLLREGLRGVDGIFVTLSTFTEAAKQEAATTGVALVDNRELYSRVEKARRSEPCPQCGEPMVLDHSSRGWWLRCVAGRCPGKRDLGADAARAMELLVERP